MLYLNVKKILDMRGIERQFTYLLDHGFIRSTAHKLVRGEFRNINLDHIERLCLLLNCSPNDLLEWQPGKNTSVAENHPLKSLNKPHTLPPLTSLVKEIPIEKLHRIEGLLQQLREED